MSKDPAVLFFISDWLTATKEMRADTRGWYLNLILHQYDKGDLPDDVIELANLADVRFDEFSRFEQVFEQVLKHKFEQNSNGRLENARAREILQGRKLFKEKRSSAGTMSYIVRFARKHFKLKVKELDYIKDNIELDGIDLKNEQVLKQVFEHLLELYRNGNEDENKDIIELPFKSEEFKNKWKEWNSYRSKINLGKYKMLEKHFKALVELSGNDEKTAIAIYEQSMANNYQGIFKLKRDGNNKTSNRPDEKPVRNYHE